ncbi:MAG: GspE/PulE family protein [Moraxellaceae bacterium]|nr:GspE/PulE family protein [Moraxellaceae bacterium]
MATALPNKLPNNDQELIPWVTKLIVQAHAQQASDLHIDPQANGAQIRLRIDGLLQDWQFLPTLWYTRLVSRIKVLAQMDLAERRLPQDGRLLDSNIGPGHIRVASLPTLFGEKLCLRFSDPGHSPSLAQLNMPLATRQALEHALSLPQGLILITGPTGSGKTTTLYACLERLNQRNRHIATVEDPIERVMPGIVQTNVQPRIGLDFPVILRALLRQDPDVLMVGEIRDGETAAMAVQAAETGHIVLSTLHTSTALDALNRLRHLGIADYLIVDTVSFVLAQRLVRKCNGPDSYDGRIGLYEHITKSHELARAWMAGTDREQLENIALRAGWPTLNSSAQEALAEGLTNAHELARVLGYNPQHTTTLRVAETTKPITPGRH